MPVWAFRGTASVEQGLNVHFWGTWPEIQSPTSLKASAGVSPQLLTIWFVNSMQTGSIIL